MRPQPRRRQQAKGPYPDRAIPPIVADIADNRTPIDSLTGRAVLKCITA
jgi:hypothetical protein